MPGDRPSPPASQPNVSIPLIDDPAIRKAMADLAEQVRQLRIAPVCVTVDGRRGFRLGGDRAGDLYYRTSSGEIARIPIGSPGQVLTVGANGLPGWA